MAHLKKITVAKAAADKKWSQAETLTFAGIWATVLSFVALALLGKIPVPMGS
jgi:hypothetical protein